MFTACVIEKNLKMFQELKEFKTKDVICHATVVSHTLFLLAGNLQPRLFTYYYYYYLPVFADVVTWGARRLLSSMLYRIVSYRVHLAL